MSNKRTNRLPKIIFGQLAVILVIVVIALGLVFYSQGYKFNWRYLKVIKTGMILLQTEPNPDHIVINGNDEGSDNNFTHTFTAGFYDITISKEEYHDWHRSLYIESQKLVAFKDIVLFLNSPKISTLINQSKIDFLNQPNSYLAENSKNDLSSSKYEIWVNGKLITRFSSPISSPIWYPDNDHIVYQKGNEIRIIDSSGFNDTGLVTLSKDTPTKFAIGNKGRELYYLDSEVYQQATIR